MLHNKQLQHAKNKKGTLIDFFICFYVLKLKDESFLSIDRYDLVAGKIKVWGYAYAFIELLLGLAYVMNIMPLFTNWITLIVMSVSIVGVLRTVLNKQKIKCACLGAVFNLPMSTVTIVEDALMIVMSGLMLLMA